LRNRGLEGAFAGAVWQAFDEAGAPGGGAEALFSDELSAFVWATAPDHALSALLGDVARAGALEALPPERFRALLRADLAAAPLELFSAVPKEALEQAVLGAAAAERQDALGVLWQRFPSELGRLTSAYLKGSGATETAAFARLLATAPPEATEALVVSLDDVDALLRAPAESLSAVRTLLHARLGKKGPGFRDAYALFHRVEARCAAIDATHAGPGR